MKTTQRKDALRNIIRQKVSYLSVVVIALLGVGSFLSISYASDSLQRNSSEQYAKMHFRDVEIISTHLITSDDLTALQGLDGVSDVEAVWQAGAELSADKGSEKFTFISIGERINTPLIREGRLPEKLTECAVERRLAELMDWHLGDTVEGYSMTDDTGQFFTLFEPLTITAIVEHPDHLCINLGETPYVLVLPSAFDHESLKDCAMKADLLMEGGTPGNRFSSQNKAVSAGMVSKIEALARERTPLRDDEVKKEAFAQIDEIEEGYKNSLKEKKDLLEELESDPSASSEDIEDARGSISYFEEALSELGETRDKVDNLAPSRWVVLGDLGSPGFVQFLAAGQSLSNLRMTFALMFIVISAMVIYATVSKMVDEQRTLIGTVKALGFYKREILGKYLVYGVSGTLAGSVLGILLARFWLEGYALNGYGKYISVDITTPRFSWGITLIVLFIGILLSVLAVWSACSHLLNAPAVELMQPAVPKGKRGTDKNERHRLSLYSRLILRNVSSDWKRVIVTVISVAGCCALLVTGFTLKHGVAGCVSKQYNEIRDYDLEVECWSYAIPEVGELLTGAGLENAPLYKTTLITNVEETSIANLLCGDLKEINRIYHINDWKTGEPILSCDDGILIQRRIAELYGLDVGSEFELSDGLSSQVTVRVGGIFENYIGLPAAMSPAYYEKVFGKPCEYNTIFVRLDGMDEDSFAALLGEADGVKTYGPGDQSDFRQSSAVIDSVVALLTVMSAILAGVVLMNLTNLFFLQKKREMTIMRINGYSVKQTVEYLLREIIVTTALGILIGIAAGSAMAYFILRSLEQSFMQFDRSISLSAWGIGFAITLLFAAIVNWLVLRNVKDLKLVDAAIQ